MKNHIVKVLAVAMLFASSTLFAQQSESRSGYYKDVFMDSGIRLSAKKYLPSACNGGFSIEAFVHSKVVTLRDTMLQLECFAGREDDTNGILLYPDGSPRFRMLFVNGGGAASHGRSLKAAGRERIREYISNGGSYVGTCAGGFIASTGCYQKNGTYKYRPEYLQIWPGKSYDTGLSDKRVTHKFEENSPLLAYYASFSEDMKIDSIYHNNGSYPALAECDSVPEGTEVLLRFQYDTIPPTSKVKIHNQASCWAYKKDAQSGRVIMMSSHPEGVKYGERLSLTTALLQYAIDGNGDPVVKGELVPGQVRQMNKKTEDNDPLFTRIGDRQYHHFKVEVPKKTKKAVIVLSGYNGEDNFDLTLAANQGEFAFHDMTHRKNVALGCNKTLVINNPQAGTWYVSVFCETTVTATEGKNGIEYSGRTDVLNGVPYKISVQFVK